MKGNWAAFDAQVRLFSGVIHCNQWKETNLTRICSFDVKWRLIIVTKLEKNYERPGGYFPHDSYKAWYCYPLPLLLTDLFIVSIGLSGKATNAAPILCVCLFVRDWLYCRKTQWPFSVEGERILSYTQNEGTNNTGTLTGYSWYWTSCRLPPPLMPFAHPPLIPGREKDLGRGGKKNETCFDCIIHCSLHL